MNGDRTDEIIQLLQEQLKWQRFEGKLKLKEILIATLRSDKEKKIYESSDGRSTNEVAAEVGVSNVTIYNYWQKWSKLGILIPSNKYKGRYQRMVSLEEVGIETPKLQKQEEAESPMNGEGVSTNSETEGETKF
ncbi:hypothetical protein HYU40_01805 [Candidatus Woesearchaeota archaeon]|nr:hypothetical protein [Candidatus Woesearchaeota archaeon]